MTPEVIGAWGMFAGGVIAALAAAMVKVRRAAPGRRGMQRELRRYRAREEQLVRVIEEAGMPVPDWPRRGRGARPGRREREREREA